MNITTHFRFLLPAFLACATAAFGAETVTLSGIHNCCKGCAKGIEKAVTSVSGATATVEKTNVKISAASTADLQKATDALVAAGYTGTSDNSAVKVQPGTAPDEKVAALTISGTHLCCGKCVTGVEKAVLAVPGVKSHTAAKGAQTFKVEGDFNAKAVMAALAAAGYTGKATK
jgi:copper chaperone CopZ